MNVAKFLLPILLIVVGACFLPERAIHSRSADGCRAEPTAGCYVRHGLFGRRRQYRMMDYLASHPAPQIMPSVITPAPPLPRGFAQNVSTTITVMRAINSPADYPHKLHVDGRAIYWLPEIRKFIDVTDAIPTDSLRVDGVPKVVELFGVTDGDSGETVLHINCPGGCPPPPKEG